jgi:hypothetical protein
MRASMSINMKRTPHKVSGNRLTSYGKLRASGEELEIKPPCWYVELGHGFNQISDCSTLDIESMVRLDGLVERYRMD